MGWDILHGINTTFNKMIEIIDNFLTKKECELINKTLTNNFFPWYYINNVSEENDGYFYFVHLVFDNNRINSPQIMDLLKPLIDKLKIKALVRIKINLYTKTEKIIEHKMHTDTKFKCKTSLYYVNTNNGYTGLKNNKKIESISNRLLNFDSQVPHFSTNCTDKNYRININFNYF